MSAETERLSAIIRTRRASQPSSIEDRRRFALDTGRRGSSRGGRGLATG